MNSPFDRVLGLDTTDAKDDGIGNVDGSRKRESCEEERDDKQFGFTGQSGNGEYGNHFERANGAGHRFGGDPVAVDGGRTAAGGR